MCLATRWIHVHAVPVVHLWGYEIIFLKLISLPIYKEDRNLKTVFAKNIYKLFENSPGSLASKYYT